VHAGAPQGALLLRLPRTVVAQDRPCGLDITGQPGLDTLAQQRSRTLDFRNILLHQFLEALRRRA
jgi:hypothetical protein